MSFDDIMACPRTGPDTGLWIRTIGGSCPCQADGTMDGYPFYFRARHGLWTLDVCNAGNDPVDGDSIFSRDGDDPDNGYMPEDKAAKIIFECWCEFKIFQWQKKP